MNILFRRFDEQHGTLLVNQTKRRGVRDINIMRVNAYAAQSMAQSTDPGKKHDVHSELLLNLNNKVLLKR
jgi:hypothetical protein